jgi:hypothetical protein
MASACCGGTWLDSWARPQELKEREGWQGVGETQEWALEGSWARQGAPDVRVIWEQ